MSQQTHIGTATVGEKHHLAGARQPRGGLVQQPLRDLIGHGGTPVLQPPPRGTARPREITERRMMQEVSHNSEGSSAPESCWLTPPPAPAA
jgi:hypothetical protein